MVLQLLLAAYVVLSAAGVVAEPSSSHAAPWSRGTYGKLTFAPDGQSYTFAYGSADELTHLTSTAGALENCTSLTSRTSTGTDPVLGAYDELTLTCGVVGELAVQYFAKLDAFLFVRRPQTADLPTVWPSMDVSAVKNGAYLSSKKRITRSRLSSFPKTLSSIASPCILPLPVNARRKW